MTSAATEGGRRATGRLFSALGAAWGLALLIRPEGIVAGLCPEYPDDRMWVVRVLGARLVAQHVVVLASPGPGPLRAAAAVDGVHALSMLPLLRSPRYGRAAAISAAVAAAYAAAAPVLAPRPASR